MFQSIRTSKTTKIIIYYLCITLFLQIVQPTKLYALTEGASQPEFNSFTPIGTSDMVDLTSGDFNYNIPIMDVGGYPINLAYNSGVTMDQESSWVGLGWNLNVGQINRNVRGMPDDFKGDEIETTDNMKTNLTVGVKPYINFQLIGLADAEPHPTLGGGLDIQYNNYRGLQAIPSYGASFVLNSNVSVGMQLSSSTETGVSIMPSVSLSTNLKNLDKNNNIVGSISPSITYNSRQGLQSFNLSGTIGRTSKFIAKPDESNTRSSSFTSGSGSISFATTTFTPNKRLALKNNSAQFGFSGGGDAWGFHIEGSFAGYASIQDIKDKHRKQKAYGYEFTELASANDLLDFNREKEEDMITKKTLVLPVTNYTYDVYTIQGQNAGGQFRPFRSQTGYVFDPMVIDYSSSTSMGVEIEAGTGAHYGMNFNNTMSSTYTGLWNTPAVQFLKEKTTGNERDYETVYFKNIGENRVDNEYKVLLVDQLAGPSPITLTIDGNKNAVNKYQKKVIIGSESMLANANATTPSFNMPIKRTHREKRNQLTQKITVKEATDNSLAPSLVNINAFAKPHHTAGYIITDENGGRNVYGEAVYNKEKDEVTFATGDNANDCHNGLVKYFPGDNTASNTKGRDNYFNKIVTPAYAHTYLLSSVLSYNYEDKTGNGPSDDDLGSYTKFTYANMGEYKWRVPYGNKINVGNASGCLASYNEGLKTDKGSRGDQKGSYLYGTKENKYLTKIETKTHIAFFDLGLRKDGYGVDGENGSGTTTTTSRMYLIKSIRLYSKPELEYDYNEKQYIDPGTTSGIKPIKTAHFQYDYSLCPNVENNNGMPENTDSADGTSVNGNIAKGKLTLRNVYFTYKNSNMGKYTPYTFNYSSVNPEYNVKNYDIWGNYLPNAEGACDINSAFTTPQEFPYVKQTDRPRQNDFSSAWSITSIVLPSGGKMDVKYETDDYQYVQNKRAMQMYKIAGVSTEPAVDDIGQNLYGGLKQAKYVAIKLDANEMETDPGTIIHKYTAGMVGTPVYFNFLLNMKDNDYDYVTGYFEMEGTPVYAEGQTGRYLFIPMKYVNKEGKEGSNDWNPISVAGWFFGRENLNRYLYNDFDTDQINIVTLAKSLLSNLAEMKNIFDGANEVLRNKGCCKTFKKDKSWIRLLEPSGSKMGGGSRVKSVVLHDEWEKMLDSNVSQDIDRYAKQYGQEYDYTLSDGTSSGVATYEPNMSKENPLVMPFYHEHVNLTARAYQEKPFGESFFPSPTVTYSKVSVSNINSANTATRTGKVVTQHYTTKDFPTITDFTNLKESNVYKSNEEDVIGAMMKSMFGLKIVAKTDLTMTQGFTIETNDMNGKIHKQEIFNSAGDLVSGIEYKYNTQDNDKSALKNEVMVIDREGNIQENAAVGVHYDVINDFRESYSNTYSAGFNANLDFIPTIPLPLVIGMIIPESADHTQILHTAVTTKVIHRTGILKEKIAFDLGSTVATKNMAWDAETGQVLLTQTTNEFNDNYYTLNYPAHWAYPEMGMASENADITGLLKTSGMNGFVLSTSPQATDLDKTFKLGDELLIPRTFPGGFGVGEINVDPEGGGTGSNVAETSTRAWVINIKTNSYGIQSLVLMDRNGKYIDPCMQVTTPFPFRIIRSGNRNQQMASMASVTTMTNPISGMPGAKKLDHIFLYTASEPSKKVVNASAIVYKDYWKGQTETAPVMPNDESGAFMNSYVTPDGILKVPYGVNPYVYNIKGDWRAEKSYAYLTGRNTVSNYTGHNPRDLGFFNSFQSFYSYGEGRWEALSKGWTYASSVTMYSPYGMELENADALNRYSSADYGYQYTLPMAVASNSQYCEMGYEGFEEQYGNRHFGFTNTAGLDFMITEAQAHTGRNSLRVPPGQEAILGKIMDKYIPGHPQNENCNENPEDQDDAPSCPGGGGHLLPDSNGNFTTTIHLDFGNDGPGSVVFCNPESIWHYDGTSNIVLNTSNISSQHYTYVTIMDGDTTGDKECITLELYIFQDGPITLEHPFGTAFISAHCSKDCLCN